MVLHLSCGLDLPVQPSCQGGRMSRSLKAQDILLWLCDVASLCALGLGIPHLSESSHVFPVLCPPTPTSQNGQSPEGDTVQLLAVQNTGYVEVQESGSREGQRLLCGEGGFAGRAALGLQASCGTSLDCSSGKGGSLCCVFSGESSFSMFLITMTCQRPLKP